MYMNPPEKTPETLERWANAHKLVSTIPCDDRFDINTFGRAKDTECGTAACIAGHAGLHPWFRDRGFFMSPEKNGLEFPRLVAEHSQFAVNPWKFWGVSSWSSTPFDPNIYRDAMTKTLFSPTPKQAAEMIRTYLLKYFPNKDVVAALWAATATYDPQHVHDNADWSIFA